MNILKEVHVIVKSSNMMEALLWHGHVWLRKWVIVVDDGCIRMNSEVYRSKNEAHLA